MVDSLMSLQRSGQARLRPRKVKKSTKTEWAVFMGLAESFTQDTKSVDDFKFQWRQMHTHSVDSWRSAVTFPGRPNQHPPQ